MLKGLMNNANSTAADFDTESVVMLPVSQIHPSPAQARKVFDAGKLAELAETIKAHGVLQPIIVTPTKTGYNLIAGERRLRDSKIAGRVEIPAIVRDSDPKGLAVLGMIAGNWSLRQDGSGTAAHQGTQIRDGIISERLRW